MIFPPQNSAAKIRNGSQFTLAAEVLEERQMLSTVQIFAAGTTGQEEIQLVIDGNAVATYSELGSGADAGDFQTLTFETDDTVTGDQVRVEFVNDLFDATNGIDRNVRIDAIAIDGVRFETEAPKVFSTGTYADGGVEPGFGRGDTLHSNGYFQYASSDEPTSPVEERVIAQTGSVTVEQESANQWFSVSFEQALQDAVVVISPVSFNGANPVHARVRNVTETGFEFQFEEWNYLDGSHIAETISWFAVERGVHTLADGAIIEAGSTQVGEEAIDVDLENAFDGAPIVIGQVASEDGTDPLVHRIDNVTQSGFEARLQVEEARRGVEFELQEFHYIAFSSGEFEDFATGEFVVDEDEATTSLATGYDGIVLADQQTLNGGDTAGLRITGQTDTSLSLFVEEEQSRDAETAHIFETVGWVLTNQTIFTSVTIPEPDPTPEPLSSGDGLFVEYFEGTNFDDLVRDGVESTVDFDFGRSSPDGLPLDNFSIRFTGQVEALFSEEYTFETTSDDGIRLFVNDQLIIDNFTPHSPTVDRGTIVLEAGEFYDIRLEYFERTGNATVQLGWSSASQTREIIPQSQLYSSTSVSESPADDPTGDPENDAPVTYYVSPEGSDDFSLEEAQDRSTPWQSIGRAVFSARAGDTVIVADGTYTEGVFLDNSGTADQEIILRAENLQGVRLLGFIHGRDVSYITVEGFDVTNSNEGSIAQGIVFYSSHHITVSNNLVRDSFGGGISFNQSDSILIEGNTVHGNAFFHPDAHSGISVYQPQRLDDSQEEYGVIIRNNISFGNANIVPNQNCCDGHEVTDGNGIILDDYQNLQPSGNGVDYDRRTLVENNIVYDNGGQGIHVFFSNLIDIRNNTAFNNVTGQGEGAQINVSDSRDVNIYNNIALIGLGQNSVRSVNSSRVTLQYNILDGPDVGFANDPTNFYDTNPEFVPGTFELAVGSVGVDQGLEVDDPFRFDVFGRDRVVGRIDIGASERQV